MLGRGIGGEKGGEGLVGIGVGVGGGVGVDMGLSRLGIVDFRSTDA